jgi:hypothetical protein
VAGDMEAMLVVGVSAPLNPRRNPAKSPLYD